MTRFHRFPAGVFIAGALSLLGAVQAPGQASMLYQGDQIPPHVEAMYNRGIQFLISTQTEAGSWPDSQGQGPGVAGAALMALMAQGDDPNHSMKRAAIHRTVQYILASASEETGYIGTTMYNHGFATLALAEAYGEVRDRRIGPALKRAVEQIVTSQANNVYGAWRYGPTSADADTTVSGTQFMALVAARNAGIAVPDTVLQKAYLYFRNTQLADGGFGYTSAAEQMSSPARSAIGTLVYAMMGQHGTPHMATALQSLRTYEDQPATRSYPYYSIYYAAQAYFHADMHAWSRWNEKNIAWLQETQNPDGSWSGSHGATFSTAAALLSVAVSYRLLPIYER